MPMDWHSHKPQNIHLNATQAASVPATRTPLKVAGMGNPNTKQKKMAVVTSVVCSKEQAHSEELNTVEC